MIKYRPEIDGLRTVAVIPVILFHAGIDFFSGGFVGVDVFFVISGYLISSILLKDLKSEKFSIVHFYNRRARRIMPALIFTMLIVSIVAWCSMTPIELRAFGNALIGVSLFSSNLYFGFNSAYFSESSELNPLIHTWSLGVEEQYYIFFPILLLVIYKYFRKHLFNVVLFFLVISITLSEFGWRTYSAANFYFTPTRIWELLFGVIAAIYIQNNGTKSNGLLSSCGLFLIVISMVFYNKEVPCPSVYMLVPVLGAFLVIMYTGECTVVGKILSSKIFVGLGLISYSAYLWHQPIFAFYRINQQNVELSLYSVLLLTFITILISYFSWRYIEKPFRNNKRISIKTVFILSFSGLVILGGIGCISKSISSNGFGENQLAKKLSVSKYVYFHNMDEKKFIEGRLENVLDKPNVIVMGSSRLMQVGTDMINDKVLNLSISGANVNDYIAFVGESVSKLNPKKLILGADPWLFNYYDFNNRDRYLKKDQVYQYWYDVIVKNNNVSSLKKIKNDNNEYSSFFYDFYKIINIRTEKQATNGKPESISKKSYDGVHIYDFKYSNLSEAQKESNFDMILNYKMAKYRLDSVARNRYISLVKWLKEKGVDVTIVLSPYHPKLYDRIKNESPIFKSIQNDFYHLADSLGIRVIGSYDPRDINCISSDFYDGMHPKASCMKKLFSKQ